MYVLVLALFLLPPFSSRNATMPVSLTYPPVAVCVGFITGGK